MTKIFISYRRSDDPFAARGINDALCKRFGRRNVYFDLDVMHGGLDFRKQIDDMVAVCDVMVVVIGKKWLQIDESGNSRLLVTDDFVRTEVSSSLNRDIPVIPVLVGSAKIPDKDMLPEDIQPLIYRHAIEIETSNFQIQIDKLVKTIETVAPSGRWRLQTWIISAVLAIFILGIGLFAWKKIIGEDGLPPKPTPTDITKIPTERSPGVYTVTDLKEGDLITDENIIAVAGDAADDRPMTENHVVDFCTNTSIPSGNQLSWQNLDFCK